MLDVVAFFLVWFIQKEGPGFWISFRNGDYGTVDVLSHGHCVPKRNEEADEVSWS